MVPLLPSFMGHKDINTSAYRELLMCFFFFILTQGTAGRGYSWSLRFSTGLEKSYLG